MTHSLKSVSLPDPFPAQQAYVAIELKPADAAEKRRLEALRRHVQAHTHTTDLRGLAGAVKKLLGSGYDIGCGSTHIWVRRAGEDQRLAIVGDRLKTAYRDWFEPHPGQGPATSRNRRRLPIAGTPLTSGGELS